MQKMKLNTSIQYITVLHQGLNKKILKLSGARS